MITVGVQRERISEKGEMIAHCKRIPPNSNFLNNDNDIGRIFESLNKVNKLTKMYQ